MIRVLLPQQLQSLARISGEVKLNPRGPATLGSILDAVESKYPMLRGTLRDQVTKKRRPLVRFFACGNDFSNKSAEAPLPEEIVKGTEPLLIIGAIAGG